MFVELRQNACPALKHRFDPKPFKRTGRRKKKGEYYFQRNSLLLETELKGYGDGIGDRSALLGKHNFGSLSAT